MTTTRDFSKVTLQSLADGAAGERFNRELSEVLENVRDPNTSYKKARKVTLELTIAAEDDERTLLKYAVSVNKKIVPMEDLGGIMYVEREGSKYIAVTQDPDQPDMFPTAERDDQGNVTVNFDNPDQIKNLTEYIDKRTGEVKE